MIEQWCVQSSIKSKIDLTRFFPVSSMTRLGNVYGSTRDRVDAITQQLHVVPPLEMLIVTNTDTHTRTFRILVLNSLTNTQLLSFPCRQSTH